MFLFVGRFYTDSKARDRPKILFYCFSLSLSEFPGVAQPGKRVMYRRRGTARHGGGRRLVLLTGVARTGRQSAARNWPRPVNLWRFRADRWCCRPTIITK